MNTEPCTNNSDFIKNLQTLTTSICEGVIITDAKENIVWVNKAYEDLCGTKLEHIIGKKPNIFQGFKTDKGSVRKIREALNEGISIDTEILNYKPDKTPFWVQLSISPVKNEGGEITHFVGFEHDITNEKNIESELKESERLYEDLFDMNPCALWLYDPMTLCFIEVNQAAIDMYGYSREEYLNMTLKDVRYSKDAEKIINEVKSVITENRDHEIWRHIKKNGDVINVEIKTNALNYKGDLCILSQITDVTGKLKREEDINELNAQLEERLKFIEQVGDNIPGSLFQTIYYPDGKVKIAYGSVGFEKLIGIPIREIIKDPSMRFKLIHPADQDASLKAFADSIKNLTKLDHKFRYVNKTTGKITWVHVHAVPVKKKDDSVVLTGVMINVNESVENYAKLKNANQRFEYVSKAANELIWDLDLVTNIISFGGSYKEMFGHVYPDDKTELTKIKHLIYKEDEERVYKGIADALADPTKRFWEETYRVIKADGSLVYVHDRAYIIYDEKTNKPVRFVGVIQDISREKMDEKALSDQMQKVSMIVESITDIFYVVDRSFSLLYTNEAMESLAGSTKADLMGKNVWKVFEDANLLLPKSEFENAFRKNRASNFEMEYKGRIFFVNLYPSEIGLAVSGKDITEQKNREQEIRRNEKFIKEISESTAGFILQTEYFPDGSSKLNYASEKIFDFMGISVRELMKDPARMLESIHPEDLEYFKKKRAEMVSDLTDLNVKYRYVNKITKKIKWVKGSAIPTRLKNGNTIVNGIIIDISEIENNYKQLEEANRRYEYLSKATHEIIWEVDFETRQIKLSGAYKEILGHEYPNDTGTIDEWKSIIHPDDLDRVLNSIEAALADASVTYWECSYRVIRKDGETIDIFTKGYVVDDEKNNSRMKIIGSAQDVTLIKKAQEEKDKMLADVVKRNKTLEQFTFMVSHNLRAPIANMMGVSTILEDEDLHEDTKKEMLDINQKSISRLNEVIGDMNEILNIRKSIEEKKEKVVFQTILNEVIEVELTAVTNIKVHVYSDFKKAGSIHSIKSYLYGIFQNLISNSIKYRCEGPSFIKITSDEDEEYIYLKFEDNGIGIDLGKNHNKIFGLYNRFHSEKEGKGMGLYMVKSQVEDLNGEITVDSGINKGTTFNLKFKKADNA